MSRSYRFGGGEPRLGPPTARRVANFGIVSTENGRRARDGRTAWCAPCGKWQYPDRSTAKRAARRNHPGDHMRAYPCSRGGFHFGHVPEPVLRGAARIQPRRTDRVAGASTQLREEAS